MRKEDEHTRTTTTATLWRSWLLQLAEQFDAIIIPAIVIASACARARDGGGGGGVCS
jgi:hypothetical protein